MRLYTMLWVLHLRMSPCITTEKCGRNCTVKKLFGTSCKRRRRRKPIFKAGEKVMLSKVRRTLKKGYLPGLTEEIFIVDRVINSYVPSYKIKEYDGTPVKGTFYEEELQRSMWVIKTRFSRSKKYSREKTGKLWSVGKVGLPNTTVG